MAPRTSTVRAPAPEGTFGGFWSEPAEPNGKGQAEAFALLLVSICFPLVFHHALRTAHRDPRGTVDDILPAWRNAYSVTLPGWAHPAGLSTRTGLPHAA